MSQPRTYRYYEFVMAGFVTVLVCSNLIGPAKAAQIDLPLIGALTFGAGTVFFPISYVFGDILTEVSGTRCKEGDLGRVRGARVRSAWQRSWSNGSGAVWKHRRRRIAFGSTWPRCGLVVDYFCGELGNRECSEDEIARKPLDLTRTSAPRRGRSGRFSSFTARFWGPAGIIPTKRCRRQARAVRAQGRRRG